MKTCKAVVFDMDGVIFDSEQLVLQCWHRVGENIPELEETCRLCIGLNADRTREIFQEKYGVDFPYDAYKEKMSALYWKTVEAGGLALKPGVRDFLQWLKANGYATAVASSTRTAVVEKELRLFGLAEYFDTIVGGDMVQRSKPAPDIFLTACQTLAISPKDGIAVEDSYNGIRSAHAAGMHPVMIPDMLPATAEMEQLAEQIFSDMTQLQRFLIQ